MTIARQLADLEPYRSDTAAREELIDAAMAHDDEMRDLRERVARIGRCVLTDE